MNKKILIALAVVLAIAVSAVFAFPLVKGALIKSDPVNYLLYANLQTAKQGSVDGTVEFTFNLSQDMLADLASVSDDPKAMEAFVTGILNSVSGKARIKMAYDAKTNALSFYEQVQMTYNNDSLLSLELGYWDETAFLRVPELYGKSLTMTKSDVNKMVKDNYSMELDDIKFGDYLAIITNTKTPEYKALEKNKDVYIDLVKSLYKDVKRGDKKTVVTETGKSYTCDTLEVTIKISDVFDFYVDLLDQVGKDEHAKAYAKQMMTALLNHFKASKDYVIFDMLESDVDALLEAIETDFDDAWLTMFKEMAYAFQFMPFTDQTFKTTVAIDKSFMIREATTSFELEGVSMVQRIVYNAYGKDVVFDSLPKTSESVSLVKLVEDTSYADDAMNDFMTNGISKYLENSALTKALEDIKEKSKVLPAHESDELIYSIDNLLEQFQWALMFFSLSDIGDSLFGDYGYSYDDSDWDWDWDSYYDETLERIGLSPYGFVDLPEHWFISGYYEFAIEMMSTDIDGYITMYLFDDTENDVASLTQFIYEDFLNNDYEDLYTSEYYIGYYDSNIVYGYNGYDYLDTLCWIFESHLGIHVVKLEIDPYDFYDYVYYIEETYDIED